MDENKMNDDVLEENEDVEEAETLINDKWYIDLCEEEPETVVKEYDITATPNDFNILTLFSLIDNGVIKWLFPSPYKHEDVPRDPCSCRKKLATILERAECKHVPFHALRHTFATQALRYGMDVKTLASTIGHESVETTVNVRNPHTN